MMKIASRVILMMMLFMILITGITYPLAITGLAQMLFGIGKT